MNLAVIGRVIETASIDGADRIQQARVVCGAAGKWCGVVGLDIAVGDAVTVFLQDAVLPPNERWSFMEKHKWRVRMARFKGVPSECVIVPGAPDLPPGTDLTESLGVTKFFKPIPAAMQGDAVGPFPSFIPKTDEPNFQAVPEMVAMLADHFWYATEKADGTSCTAWVDETGLHVCSRNYELREFSESGATNVYWRAARKYGLDSLPRHVALQFEIVGPGIQGNPMGLADIEGRLFTVRSVDDQWQKDSLEDVRYFSDRMRMPMARVIVMAETGPMTDDALRELAAIKYPNGKPAEGIVIRDIDNRHISFKVLNLAYKD